MIDPKEIKELVKYFERTGLSELEIEKDGVRIKLRKEGALTNFSSAPAARTSAVQNPAAPPVVTSPAVAATEIPEPASDKLHTVKAPIIGTFYRSPGPDKEQFVKIGDTIQKRQVLCIIEAMKIFNEIESDAAGKVVKILVENAQPVEFDQPLFVIEKI